MADLVDIIKYEGDNTTFIWKHPIEDFNTGTQLIVHESQEAVFFMNGQALDLFGLNLNVCRLASGTAAGLMNHDPGMGQSCALSLAPAGQKQGTHAGGLSDTHSGHIRTDILHGIIYGHTSRNLTSRAVDVYKDVLFGIFVS